MKATLLIFSILFSTAAFAECQVDCGTMKKPRRAMELKNFKPTLAEKITALRKKYPSLTEDQVGDVISISMRFEVALAFRTPKPEDAHARLAVAPIDNDIKQLMTDQRTMMIRKNHPTLTDEEIASIAKIIE